MEWLFENPIPALATGSILTALAVISLWQTGRKLFLALALLCALVTAGLCIMEAMIVTPGEEVVDRVHALAADLERNLPAPILAYISRRSPDLLDYAQRALSEVKIHDAVAKRNLKVEVFPGRGLATATFNAVIVLDAPNHDLTNYRHARAYVLNFRFEDGAWMISDFREDSPVGPRRSP
ncbi:MAG: hypothetical protein O2931_08690 [Planctomycetota bacterium]|nr:hypothetical protein [Planctomycetota bacterium]MDA1178858.1 hypothetical protein [Planctomycetota bacterium]